ncbi:hypothetical protein [Plantactinospora endophytica]|uniref:Lantibiotic dehydratase N-terminal domain-containing protein n=1 Tax=Plantactinospora endophytica TaxID=673535 RepID=A0ABQ4DUX2_9ACTN|nr:hypothetical protein [Plantactinospora endophytica]GIG86261.1 hypothetical protein Pen02_11970 [Plantactinospora endophytica]
MTDDTAYPADWTVFEVGLLRSAGLPSQWLTRLASPRLAEADAALTAAHAELVTTRRRAVAELRAARTAQPPPPSTAVRATNRALDRSLVLPDTADDILGRPVRESWNSTVARHDELASEFETTWRTALAEEHAELVRRVTDEAFAEAVLMNSRGAHDALVREAEAGSLRFANQRVAYRYLQRFCGKAESAGHAGPVNLIHLGGEPSGVPPVRGDGQVLTHDDPLLGRIRYTSLGDGRAASRRTFLSYWAAQAMVDVLVADAGGAALLRPCRLIGAGPPAGHSLTEPEAALLAVADGSRSLADIAARIGSGTAETTALAAGLADRGLLALDRALPGYVGDPAAEAAAVALAAGTERAGLVLAVLETAERFAGRPYHRRPKALDGLAADFVACTGRPAWRGQGGFYTDRFVVSEEAFGNIEGATVPADGMRALAQRLGTVLDLLASLAVDQRLSGQRRIRELLRRTGAETLPAVDVRRLALPPSAAQRMPDGFTRLLPAAPPYVELTRADLADAGLLRADLAAWPLFGAADLMLMGQPSAAAGPGLVVLSELHHIWPPLGQPWRALFSDEAWRLDRLQASLEPVLAPARPLIQQIRRYQKGTDSSPLDHHLLCLERLEQGPGAGPVPVDGLVVREWENGFLGLHSPDRGEDYWLFPDYDDNDVDAGGLAHCALPALELPRVCLGEHTPRIVVDGVVLQRRRWDPPLGSVPVLPGRRAVGAHWRRVQHWRQRLGMPRQVFFLTDTEPKPMWLDFESALSVANLSHALSRARTVTFTEMLPPAEELWLRVPDGTLVSEIRTLVLRGASGRSPG